jgi:hypothetical protein
MTTYEVTDENETDILGCEQRDLESARIAARTLVEDGHDHARVYAVKDGERERFPILTAEPNGRGGAILRGTWGR